MTSSPGVLTIGVAEDYQVEQMALINLAAHG